jgi:hypothetical protein
MFKNASFIRNHPMTILVHFGSITFLRKNFGGHFSICLHAKMLSCGGGHHGYLDTQN